MGTDTRVYRLRDGEAELSKKVFEADGLAQAVQEAVRRGFDEFRPAFDRVMLDGPWVSTLQSTVPAHIIYLAHKGKPATQLITQRPGEKYGIFEYRWVF